MDPFVAAKIRAAPGIATHSRYHRLIATGSNEIHSSSW